MAYTFWTANIHIWRSKLKGPKLKAQCLSVKPLLEPGNRLKKALSLRHSCDLSSCQKSESALLIPASHLEVSKAWWSNLDAPYVRCYQLLVFHIIFKPLYHIILNHWIQVNTVEFFQKEVSHFPDFPDNCQNPLLYCSTGFSSYQRCICSKTSPWAIIKVLHQHSTAALRRATTFLDAWTTVKKQLSRLAVSNPSDPSLLGTLPEQQWV